MNSEDRALNSEIHLISDEHGIAVVGNQDAVECFLEEKGLAHIAERLNTKSLASMLHSASLAAEYFSDIQENSIRYIKLTKESAKLRAELGLMRTKKDGISHVMLGKPGLISKWLQAEEGLSTQLTNPAVLTAVSGFLAQAARQQEARELKALLTTIDQKLDDVRRGQRDAKLSRLEGVALAVEQAMDIREHGGNNAVAWDKIKSESETIGEVQSSALRELQALAERASKEERIGALAKATRNIEEEAGLWIAVLARCFELQDEFEILELEHVARTSPELLEGHRQALDVNYSKRRSAIEKKTTHLFDSLNKAGGIAASNILLHARAAQKTITSINNLGFLVDDVYASIGIETKRKTLTLGTWQAAIRDKGQLKTAGKEVVEKTVFAAGIVTVALATNQFRQRTNS